MNLNKELIRITADNGLVVWDTGCFGQVLQKLPQPAAQFPGLIHFVGIAAKDKVLKKLFFHGGLGHDEWGPIYLHLDPLTVDNDSPVLIVDSNPFPELSSWTNCKLDREARLYQFR
ncbi:uncharacterized protein CIMG_07391 [Coccidioides immitis RS]|uniref:Uncharacterized protein n=1 Tax=Coccidioides immitis (strain RS) TaxID=246410 RepID=J3KA88_COCIM|nr:uncharacterized protein CIMG_07391 [Coccidioides immitis RS]EAS31912.3 hypothetical protein CIMG_07391 [Coccidioides immitis RS]